MKYPEDSLKEQQKVSKSIDITNIIQRSIVSWTKRRFPHFPMKKCLLSEGSNKYVPRRNRMSHGNCIDKPINTVKYIIHQIFGFFKRPQFPMPLYNILGTSDMSDVEIDDSLYFSLQAHWKKTK